MSGGFAVVFEVRFGEVANSGDGFDDAFEAELGGHPPGVDGGLGQERDGRLLEALPYVANMGRMVRGWGVGMEALASPMSA